MCCGSRTSFSGSFVFLVLAAMAASRSVTGIAGGAAGGAVRRWKEAEDGMNDERCISVNLYKSVLHIMYTLQCRHCCSPSLPGAGLSAAAPPGP